MEKKFKRVPPEIPISELTPFNVTCTSTKCSDNLHCFKTSRNMIEKFGQDGVCRECGENLIDWKRFQKNDIKDAQFIVGSLKNELIRHVFWHIPLDDKTVQKANKYGKNKLRERSLKILKQKIGGSNNYKEGYQTPMRQGEIIHYGQHATATCCRKCLEYWHNIKLGTELTDEQLKFCSNLVMVYIEEKLPDLKEVGE